jgi:ssDNA-binding Zn-finger/Zn-ribbon topoisomerase 1
VSRPDVTLTPEESARLKGEDWKVPENGAAVTAMRKGRDGKPDIEVNRWAEVGVITEATIDQVNKDGEDIIQGRISFLISDEDHHRNTNPRHRKTVWIKVTPRLLKLQAAPEKGHPDRGPYYGSMFGVRYFESLLKALGETGVLTNRRHLLDFGALYDFLQQTDLSGREVLVNLEYPPTYENQVEPDVRYFDVVS